MGILKGDVDILGLGNLLQILSMNRREGILSLVRAEDRKTIHFGAQGIRLLSSTLRRINKLGKILLRRRRITKQDLDSLLKEQRLLGWKLGQIALTSGLVKKEDIEAALAEQIEEEVFDMFMWSGSAFEFAENKKPPKDVDHPLADLTLGKNVTSLVLEAARRADELLMIRKILDDDEITLQKFTFEIHADELGEDLETVDEIIPIINGRRSLREIVQMSIYPRFQTMRAIYRLLTLGYIKAHGRKGNTIRIGLPAERVR